jgi:alpha-tubulin suppressor-like RCC1 family protein
MAAVLACFRRRVGSSGGRGGRRMLPLSAGAALLASLCVAAAAAAGTPARATTDVSGALYAWGSNTVGELGDGTTTSHNTPETVTLATGVTATAVSAGGAFGLAIGSDGKLYAWGDNTAGELGDGTTTSHNTPEAITLATGITATATSAAGNFGLAIGSDGKLYAWGDNTAEELGDGTTTSHNTPEAITLATGIKPTAISAAAASGAAASGTPPTGGGLAIGSDGSLYAWGSNGFGQLGDGTTTSHNTPEAITLATGIKPTAISAGTLDSMAIGSDGKLYAWGDNSVGELGDGTTTQHNSPEAITLATGIKPTAISAGVDFNLAIGSDGKLYAWGDNTFGELGDGTTTGHNTPEAITLATGIKPTAVSAALFDGMAIGSDGNLYAWGSNSATINGTLETFGELGDGTTTQHNSPEVITLATGVAPVAVSAGLVDTLAIAAACSATTTAASCPTSSATPTPSNTTTTSTPTPSNTTTTSTPTPSNTTTSPATATTAPSTPAAPTNTPAAAAAQAVASLPVGAPATGGGTGTEFSGIVATVGFGLMATGAGLVVVARRRRRRRPPV